MSSGGRKLVGASGIREVNLSSRPGLSDVDTVLSADLGSAGCGVYVAPGIAAPWLRLHEIVVRPMGLARVDSESFVAKLSCQAQT